MVQAPKVDNRVGRRVRGRAPPSRLFTLISMGKLLLLYTFFLLYMAFSGTKPRFKSRTDCISENSKAKHAYNENPLFL